VAGDPDEFSVLSDGVPSSTLLCLSDRQLASRRCCINRERVWRYRLVAEPFRAVGTGLTVACTSGLSGTGEKPRSPKTSAGDERVVSGASFFSKPGEQ